MWQALCPITLIVTSSKVTCFVVLTRMVIPNCVRRDYSSAQGMTEMLLRSSASQRDSTRPGEHRICAAIRSARLSSVSEAILRRDARGNRKVFLSHMTGSIVDRNPIALWERRSDVTELQTSEGWLAVMARAAPPLPQPNLALSEKPA